MENSTKKWKGTVGEPNDGETNINNLFLSPAEKAIKIDLIRWKLFCNFLTATDLLTCRLVCKRWSEDATSALLQPKFVRSLSVSFTYTTNGPNPHNYINKSNKRTLKQWLQSRKSKSKSIPFSRHFPCTNFEFINGPLEKNEDSLKFFGMQVEKSQNEDFSGDSHRICSLTLAIWDCSDGLEVAPFLELLRPHVTHLKYLTLERIYPHTTSDPISSWYSPALEPKKIQSSFAAQAEEMELQFGKVQLVALEVFEETLSTYGLGLKIVQSVLNRAPNLKWTIDSRSRNLKAIWLEKKVHTVHSWFFYPHFVATHIPYWTDKPETSIFLETQPTLKEFGIGLEGLHRPLSARELQCVSLVLQKSQRSLEKIWDILDLLQCSRLGLEIPRMENVTTVTQQSPPLSIPVECFMNTHQGQGQGQDQEVNRLDQTKNSFKIDRGFLSQICPNVRHIIIRDPRPWGPRTVCELAFSFDQVDPLRSVSKVSVHFAFSHLLSTLTGGEITSIIRLCPNLTVIQLFLPGPRPLTFPKLFRRILENFKKIRTIAFHFQNDSNHITVKEDFDDDNGDSDPFSNKWVHEMDSAVSGLSPETCRQLALALQLENYEQAEQITNFDDKKSKPSSILDLKDLICLRFKFDPSMIRDDAQTTFVFFSRVSFQYGFDILTLRQHFYLECPKQLVVHANV